MMERALLWLQKAVYQMPGAMGTGVCPCHAAFSIGAALGTHGKHKCPKFSGRSESDCYPTQVDTSKS